MNTSAVFQLIGLIRDSSTSQSSESKWRVVVIAKVPGLAGAAPIRSIISVVKQVELAKSRPASLQSIVNISTC